MTIETGWSLPAGTLADARSGAPEELAAACAGAPTLLFVYKADCPGTAVAAPVLPRFDAVPGLRLLAISQDGPAETRSFGAASGWTGRVRALIDPEPWAVSEALGVRVTPTWILAGPDGRVEEVVEGWARVDANRLAARASELAGAPPLVVSPEGGAEPAWRPG